MLKRASEQDIFVKVSLYMTAYLEKQWAMDH
ncbi:hypothetical protein SAMN05216419_103826 [Nitrosomonas cryotolerans]|nr:hypothetical protein SAMN05216419_103826 [Nitrosomonas cryotolerans]